MGPRGPPKNWSATCRKLLWGEARTGKNPQGQSGKGGRKPIVPRAAETQRANNAERTMAEQCPRSMPGMIAGADSKLFPDSTGGQDVTFAGRNNMTWPKLCSFRFES